MRNSASFHIHLVQPTSDQAFFTLFFPPFIQPYGHIPAHLLCTHNGISKYALMHVKTPATTWFLPPPFPQTVYHSTPFLRSFLEFLQSEKYLSWNWGFFLSLQKYVNLGERSKATTEGGGG